MVKHATLDLVFVVRYYEFVIASRLKLNLYQIQRFEVSRAVMGDHVELPVADQLKEVGYVVQ